MNDYWVVIETSTGRVISHCGEETDAIMMVSFDSHKRTYRKQKFIMDQVIDISSTTDNQLPGQLGLPQGNVSVLNSYVEKLPQSEAVPFVVK
jgi:hypothetical protein